MSDIFRMGMAMVKVGSRAQDGKGPIQAFSKLSRQVFAEAVVLRRELALSA